MRVLPFIYQYSFVFIIFTIGIFLAIRGKNLNVKTALGKRYLIVLIGGLLFFILFQGFLQFFARLI